MRADSPDEDGSRSSPPPPARAAACAGEDAVDSVAETLDHFNRIVMMIELIGRLPDLAEDLRRWRPRSHDEYSRPSGAIDRYGALAPVARNAFDAVVAGLNILGSAAVALCENAGGRLSPGEIEACRDIGLVMGRLLERAHALIETVGDSRFGAARASADRYLTQKRAG